MTATATLGSARARRWRLAAARARSFAGRYVRRTDGVLALLILLGFTVIAVVPEAFVGPLETATKATGQPFEAPSAAHIFGTDDLGRDMFNRTVHGAHVSMTIGFLATLMTTVVGVLVGVFTGYRGGFFDTAFMRVADFFLVLPTFLLALILAPVVIDVIGADTEIFGIRATLLVIVAVIGVTSWAPPARIIRSQVLSLRERMFIDRARVVGAGNWRIIRRHILPNVVNLIVAQAILTFAGAVFIETSLAFIGLGDPFQPSWGQLLKDRKSVV